MKLFLVQKTQKFIFSNFLKLLEQRKTNGAKNQDTRTYFNFQVCQCDITYLTGFYPYLMNFQAGAPTMSHKNRGKLHNIVRKDPKQLQNICDRI